MQAHLSFVRTLDDDVLLHHFAELVRRDRATAAELLVDIEEIDRRKLWACEGYPSMFAMCVGRYRMSDTMAGKRIHAARTARRFPLIFGMVAAGEIHLTGVNRLAAHLTEANCAAVLARAKHKSVREIDELVAELAPRPNAAFRLVRLSERASSGRETVASALASPSPGSMSLLSAPVSPPPASLSPSPSSSSGPPSSSAPSWSSSPPPSSSMPVELVVSGASLHADAGRSRRENRDPTTPLSPGKYRLALTIAQSTRDNLKRLMDLKPDTGVPDLVDRAIAELLERTLRKKAALTSKPRAPRAQEAPRAQDGTERSRHIPAAVRAAVWKRDGGRCAFVSGDGRRCGATRRLDFHHRDPWARGGAHDVDTVELRCHGHNQYEAERDYGRAFMEEKRRAGGGASRGRRR